MSLASGARLGPYGIVAALGAGGMGDNILIARNRPSGTPKVDHIAYTLASWDTDKNVRPAVEAELERRGLEIRTTEGSFHVKDPDGFEVQIGGREQ